MLSEAILKLALTISGVLTIVGEMFAQGHPHGMGGGMPRMGIVMMVYPLAGLAILILLIVIIVKLLRR